MYLYIMYIGIVEVKTEMVPACVMSKKLHHRPTWCPLGIGYWPGPPKR